MKMTDMEMTNGVGRSYRYYKGTPLFPFGSVAAVRPAAAHARSTMHDRSLAHPAPFPFPSFFPSAHSYGLSYTSFDFKMNVSSLHFTTGDTKTSVSVAVEVGMWPRLGGQVGVHHEAKIKHTPTAPTASLKRFTS